MTTTGVEQRLTAAMTATAEHPPDPAVLRRIEALSRDRTARGATQPRAGFYAALAFGAAVVLAAMLTITNTVNRSTANTTAAATADEVSVVIDPPSYGWLVVIALLGCGAAAVRRHSKVRGQEVAAVVFVTLGVLISVGATLPSVRTGAGLTNTPPELPDLQLVASSLRWWPGSNEPLVEFRYAPVDGSALVVGTPAAEAAELDRIAQAASFDIELPNRTEACRRIIPTDQPADGQPLAWSVGDFYCLSGVADGQVVVTGEVVEPNWTWWRYLLGYPLGALGLILGLLAIADARRVTAARSTGSQFAYGLVLLLMGIPLFMLGWLGMDAVRVADVGPFPDCRFSAALTDRQFLDCRTEITETLRARGLRDAGSRLYWPVLAIADTFGAIMAVTALVIAAGLASAGHLSIGRRRMLAGLLILLVLTLVPQALYYDTIQIMTDVFE